MEQDIHVYFCSQYQTRTLLRDVRTSLERAGIMVRSRWIDNNDERPMSEWIDVNLVDLTASEVVVFFSLPEQHGWPTPGRHVELGHALALKKKVILVGKPESLFHFHPRIEVVPKLEGLPMAIIRSFFRVNEYYSAESSQSDGMHL